MQFEEKKPTGIKRLETRIGRLWGFRREEKGVVTRLSPEKTVRRLVHLFIGSVDTMSSFLRDKIGESGLRSMFEYEGEKFGEGWEKRAWRADDIAENMIRLNFQPFGIEAQYKGDKDKATIIVSKCPLPEKFLQSVEFLAEFTIEPRVSIRGEEMFTSIDKVSSSWDWPPKKTEICATCRIVMPKLGKKLGFSWKHRTTQDVPPKCVFDIEITEPQKQT
ncbi:MAG: hypothetical protein ACETV1_00615 [Candidatus Bathyarchaeia archaeon]